MDYFVLKCVGGGGVNPRVGCDNNNRLEYKSRFLWILQKGIVIDTNSSKKLYDKQDIFTTSSQLIRVNMVQPIFHFGIFVVFYVSSDTNRRLKTLQSTFRALKRKEKVKLCVKNFFMV